MAVRIDPEGNEPAALTRIGTNFDAARVLEIGCGDGRLTRTFAASARQVVAIDPDPVAIREFLDAAWPSHVEARAVGLETFQTVGRFDVIVFSWSL